MGRKRLMLQRIFCAFVQSIIGATQNFNLFSITQLSQSIQILDSAYTEFREKAGANPQKKQVVRFLGR